MDNINNQSMIRVILDSFHKNGAYYAKTEINILESQLARRRLAQRQEQYQEDINLHSQPAFVAVSGCRDKLNRAPLVKLSACASYPYIFAQVAQAMRNVI